MHYQYSTTTKGHPSRTTNNYGILLVRATSTTMLNYYSFELTMLKLRTVWHRSGRTCDNDVKTWGMQQENYSPDESSINGMRLHTNTVSTQRIESKFVQCLDRQLYWIWSRKSAPNWKEGYIRQLLKRSGRTGHLKFGTVRPGEPYSLNRIWFLSIYLLYCNQSIWFCYCTF